MMAFESYVVRSKSSAREVPRYAARRLRIERWRIPNSHQNSRVRLRGDTSVGHVIGRSVGHSVGRSLGRSLGRSTTSSVVPTAPPRASPVTHERERAWRTNRPSRARRARDVDVGGGGRRRRGRDRASPALGDGERATTDDGRRTTDDEGAIASAFVSSSTGGRFKALISCVHFIQRSAFIPFTSFVRSFVRFSAVQCS